jgi:uncharacterized protein DUF6256
MASDLISQDVLPIGTGYVILMGVLAAGLRLQRRDAIKAAQAAATSPADTADTADTAHAPSTVGASDRADTAEPLPGAAPGSGGKKPGAVARRMPAGWPRFAVQVCSVALGGYVLLMAVDLLYYYGVARVAGQFIESGFTGGLLLLGIALPLFGLASWLELRRRQAKRHADGREPT